MTLYRLVVSLLVYAWLAAACGRGDAAGGAGAGGGPMPAMAVEAVALRAKPVERVNEYIATVKSRRSTIIQPQVEGFITRIVARPGQRVRRGSVLMHIDAGRQEAAVASLDSLRAAREADAQWARQQAERAKKLLDAGAVSQQEYEQAAMAVRTTEAQLRAVEAQIREQRVELGYHRVTAPTSGIVGDIPVRVGDRVTRATVLTTIDENAGLELYINVPVQQAPSLRTGLLVRLIDDAGGEIGTTTINFVAPSVDPSMQTVLAKAPLGRGLPFRPDQVARVQVVWTAEPAVTVPLVAVTRINAQPFVFVVEQDKDGTTRARQRAVQLGALVGNDYVVSGGVKEGEQVVVGGVQKVGDGAPVKVSAPAATGVPGR